MIRFAIAIALAAGCIGFAPPAHAGPGEWCNPSSPTFDKYVCFGETPGLPLVCDPNVTGYNPYYCAAASQQQAR